MAEQAIRSQLAAIPALGDRVYPNKLPQNVVYPAAVYQRIGPTNRFPAFGGDADLVEVTFQLDIYGQSSQAEAAFALVTTAVRKAVQRQTFGNVEDVFLDNESDDYEDETDLIRKSFDVRAWYRET